MPPAYLTKLNLTFQKVINYEPDLALKNIKLFLKFSSDLCYKHIVVVGINQNRCKIQ